MTMVRAVTWGNEGRIAAQFGSMPSYVKSVVGSSRMKFSRQTTLRSRATVTGVGVHSGLPVSLTLGPASIDAGFIFVRAAPGGCEREVQATAESVISTEFATVLGDCDGPLVSTAEHVLAALRGMGID